MPISKRALFLEGCAFFIWEESIMSKGLKLSEILVTVLIAVVFAVIYNLWNFVYKAVQITGLHLEELTYGAWFMAAVVAYLIIPKAGIALLAEFCRCRRNNYYGTFRHCYNDLCISSRPCL